MRVKTLFAKVGAVSVCVSGCHTPFSEPHDGLELEELDDFSGGWGDSYLKLFPWVGSPPPVWVLGGFWFHVRTL